MRAPDVAARIMTPICEIADLKQLARKRVPRMFYEYAESGSWTESTLHANRHDLAEIKLRQRVAVDISERSVAAEMIGQPVSMPVALAPIGLCGMQHADGEIKAARAAANFGVPFTLSTMSICSIEDVAEHTDKPFWFQLYVMRDRDFSDRLIDRIDAYLEFPQTDPHGDPIPRSDGTVDSFEGRKLTEWPCGQPFRLIRVLDQSSDFLRFQA